MKNRPAGFRTYMLVCVGATLVMSTNQYVYQTFGASDPTRLGAQVVSGIGFLGAGTIMVTKRNQIKGLTTAAGLWAVACIGLAIGIGFYAGAIIGGLAIFLANTVLHTLDDKIRQKGLLIDIYIEFSNISHISSFLSFLHKQGMEVKDMSINKGQIPGEEHVALIVTIDNSRRLSVENIIEILSATTGIE
ncbi:MAG: MgtC/SapB family protein, partial [Clostridiales bacterium]|nr:MgtC/SapB family protein [Clostridiales bacterium]